MTTGETMLAKVFSSTVIGIDAHLVDVEVDISHGLPVFTMVGLPETAVKESRERVKSAINNSGYVFPDDRITVNLAPADIKKEGTGFDLPMALGILTATHVISHEMVDRFMVLGELSLDGSIKPVKGSLPMAIAAREAGYAHILVPHDNRLEAAVVQGVSVYPAKHLSEVVEFLRGLCEIKPEKVNTETLFQAQEPFPEDFSEVMGQEYAKRAMEIAAAGGHNLIMIGPPGSGKTMLARRMPTILPPITFEEAIETTKVYSVLGMLPPGRAIITERPFRAPHHTISDAGLIGGGQVPRPGEVSLSHNGVLFLDELAEYRKNVLEVLRQPLEDRQVTISRAAMAITYPASFTLLAAMNPCPCGYLGDPKHACRCSPRQIHHYRSRISGPLLDRIDIHVEVPAIAYKDLRGVVASEPSSAIRKRVSRARLRQTERYAKDRLVCNAQMGNRQIRKHCQLSKETDRLLENVVDKLGMSARTHNRILKIARTIADLEASESTMEQHVAEAIQYRCLDRKMP